MPCSAAASDEPGGGVDVSAPAGAVVTGRQPGGDNDAGGRHAGEKRVVRARMRAVLHGVSEARREAAGHAVAAALTGHPRWPVLSCMLGFAATGREPATAPALGAAHAAGLVVALPRVAGKSLQFHRVVPDSRAREGAAGLHPGYRGIAEPPPEAPLLDFEGLPSATVVLVPGAAFDRSGGRIGWGGGYYDRALAAVARSCATALVIGVCFSEQLVDRVPRAEHDLPVDLVVTEHSVVDACHDPRRASSS